MNSLTTRLHTDRNLTRPAVERFAADTLADMLEPLIQGALLLSLVGALLVSGYAIAAPATAARTVTANAVAGAAVSPAPSPVTRTL